MLTVAGLAPGKRIIKSRWICVCDCGNRKVEFSCKLINGKSKSCGCNRSSGSSRTAIARTTHGMSYHPLYKVHAGMVARCYDPKHIHYAGYGGRGIRVCREWLSSRRKFFNWALSHGYKFGLTLHRVDNDKGYSPLNCEFASKLKQANSRRNSIRLSFNGQTRTMTEWSAIIGIPRKTIDKRVRDGWSVAEALTTTPERNSWKRIKCA